MTNSLHLVVIYRLNFQSASSTLRDPGLGVLIKAQLLIIVLTTRLRITGVPENLLQIVVIHNLP